MSKINTRTHWCVFLAQVLIISVLAMRPSHRTTTADETGSPSPGTSPTYLPGPVSPQSAGESEWVKAIASSDPQAGCYGIDARKGRASTWVTVLAGGSQASGGGDTRTANSRQTTRLSGGDRLEAAVSTLRIGVKTHGEVPAAQPRSASSHRPGTFRSGPTATTTRRTPSSWAASSARQRACDGPGRWLGSSKASPPRSVTLAPSRRELASMTPRTSRVREQGPAGR